jgi:hypothetical protein
VRFAACDQRGTKFAASLDLALSLFTRANLRRAGAAAARQCRQRLKRRARSAEMVEQRGAWADILAADKAESVEPLLIRQNVLVLYPRSPERSVPLPYYRQEWNRTHMLQNTP